MTLGKRDIIKKSFTAQTKNGKNIDLIEYEELLLTHSHDEKNSGKLGSKRYKTDSGLAVTKIDSKTYKIDITGEIVRVV